MFTIWAFIWDKEKSKFSIPKQQKQNMPVNRPKILFFEIKIFVSVRLFLCIKYQTSSIVSNPSKKR